MSASYQEEIIEKINWDSDKLLQELGSQVLSEGKGAFPFNKKQLLDAGKKWLTENKILLANAICSNKKIKKYFSDENVEKDRLEIASVLLDILSSLSIGVSPVTVSLLIVQQGIKEICLNHKQ